MAVQGVEPTTPISSLSEFGTPTSGEMNQECSSSSGAVPAPQPSFEIPKEVLEPAIQFPFALAAKRTGFDGFALGKEEVDAIVPLADQCAKQYLPTTMGPHSALIMLCGTVIAITGMKYMMFLDWRAGKTGTPSEIKHVPAEQPGAA